MTGDRPIVADSSLRIRPRNRSLSIAPTLTSQLSVLDIRDRSAPNAHAPI
jgi:hypothetical protein